MKTILMENLESYFNFRDSGYGGGNKPHEMKLNVNFSVARTMLFVITENVFALEKH